MRASDRWWWPFIVTATAAYLAGGASGVLAVAGQPEWASRIAGLGAGPAAVALICGVAYFRLRRAERNRIPDLEDLGRYFDNRSHGDQRQGVARRGDTGSVRSCGGADAIEDVKD